MGTIAAGARTRAFWFAALCGAVLISRWALFPHYLITFDEINFALAIDRFDPRLHQPQAPGYPLFVALLKLLSHCTRRVEVTFLTASVLLSVAALLLLWRLGNLMSCSGVASATAPSQNVPAGTSDEIQTMPNRAATASERTQRACFQWSAMQLGNLVASRQTGILAALLLLFNPTFWLGGLIGTVRLCFAVGAIAVALCGWKACVDKSARWLAIGAGVLGLASGARPALALLMAPLLIWVAWRIRLPWKAALFAVLCFGAAVATWLPPLILASGGCRSYLGMLSIYSQNQIAGTSVLFGAALYKGLRMGGYAVAWSCLGTLSWIWAVPLIMRKGGRVFDSFTATFLALWFFPGLLFYATFHVANPDHTLSIVPATCVAGALVIAALTADMQRARRITICALCVLLNLFLFFKPITKTTKPCTYTPIKWMSGYVGDVIDGVRSLEGQGPVTAVFAEAITGWRQLSYYDPAAHIVVLMKSKPGELVTRHISGRRIEIERVGTGAAELPSCGVIAWVDPRLPPSVSNGTSLQSIHSRIFFARATPGQSFQYHGATFTATADCGKSAAGY